jgi:hypothetical protein
VISEVEQFAAIAVEDLIADRMGQYYSDAAPEMLGQAIALFRLYEDCDSLYLEKRIREETNDEYGIGNLCQGWRGSDPGGSEGADYAQA